MATAEKVLSILRLFTIERPEWTVEEAMEVLSLTSSTAYGYFKNLVDAGLLTSIRNGRYEIGPAVLSMDRVVRLRDRLISEASGPLQTIVDELGGETVALLCRSFRNQVMCVDQRRTPSSQIAVSYERGRAMPLFRGAHSKAILAQLTSRATRRLWDTESSTITAAGLGSTWEAFKVSLRTLRRQSPIVAHAEVDQGVIGIASPVFDAGQNVIGSFGAVLRDDDVRSIDGLLTMAMSVVMRQTAVLNKSMVA